MIGISLGNTEFDKSLNIIKSNDLIELRMDLLNFSDEDFSKITEFSDNLILTYRNIKSNYKRAINFYQNAIDINFRYIDFELDEIEFINKLNNLENSKTKLIVSHHNFTFTPENNFIKSQIERMIEFKPDIIKLCYFANSIDDILRVQNLYKKFEGIKLIAFSLGQIASLSRIFALKNGAPFMYAAYSEETKIENSQLTKSQINQFLELL